MKLAVCSIAAFRDGIWAYSILGSAANLHGTNRLKVALDMFSTNSISKQIRNTERAARFGIDRCGAKAGGAIGYFTLRSGIGTALCFQ